MDQIDFNMEESPIEEENFAQMVERRLVELREQCSDPEQKGTIDLEGIVAMMGYMAKQLPTEDGASFENDFISYLHIVTKLAKNPTFEFDYCFRHLTKLLCELCGEAQDLSMAKFIDGCLIEWLRCLGKMHSRNKLATCRQLDLNVFQPCADYLVKVGRISTQLNMLDILCSYMENEYESLQSICTFLSGTHQHQRGVLDPKMLATTKTSELSLLDKQALLRHINQMNANHSIMAASVESVQFGDAALIPCSRDEGWLYFNVQSNTMECWVTCNIVPTLITVSSRRLKAIEKVGFGSTREFRFILNSPPRCEYGYRKTFKGTNFEATTINVVFGPDVCQKQLESVLFERIEMRPDIVRRASAKEALRRIHAHAVYARKMQAMLRRSDVKTGGTRGGIKKRRLGGGGQSKSVEPPNKVYKPCMRSRAERASEWH